MALSASTSSPSMEKLIAFPKLAGGLAYGARKASEDIPHRQHADVHDGPVQLCHETLDGGLACKQALREMLPVRPIAELARQMRQRVLGNDHLTDEIGQPVDPLRVDAKHPRARPHPDTGGSTVGCRTGSLSFGSRGDLMDRHLVRDKAEDCLDHIEFSAG